mmetsp:Transcript_24788/g.32855  ORF Transcript_24788/g.32855 Transcript_24788/m.32855 type:complete len:89 (+) Transcript_24788:309-575(+)
MQTLYAYSQSSYPNYQKYSRMEPKIYNQTTNNNSSGQRNIENANIQGGKCKNEENRHINDVNLSNGERGKITKNKKISTMISTSKRST